MRKSAGVLVCRLSQGSVQVLLVHSTGRKDLQPWSLPKGEFDPKQSRDHRIRTGSGVSAVVGTHHGTIVNADELFREYGLERAGEVDSEILCRMAGAAMRAEGIDPRRSCGWLLHAGPSVVAGAVCVRAIPAAVLPAVTIAIAPASTLVYLPDMEGTRQRKPQAWRTRGPGEPRRPKTAIPGDAGVVTGRRSTATRSCPSRLLPVLHQG